MEPEARCHIFFLPSGPPLGPVLRLLGLSWGHLGPSGGLLELPWSPLRSLLGPLWAILEASGAVLGAGKPVQGNMSKVYVFPREWADFGWSGPSWEASWGPLGASWRLLEPSWGHLGRLGAIFRRLGALLERLEALLAGFGAFVLNFGHEDERAGGAGERWKQGRGHGTSFPEPCIWAHFLSGRRKTQGLGH